MCRPNFNRQCTLTIESVERKGGTVKSPLIQNETEYDGRKVSGIIRWVFRRLEVDGHGVMVKVKYHRYHDAYVGRIYYNARASRTHLWNDSRGEWQLVGPNVPSNVRTLIVCRIGREDLYPQEANLYERRDMPEPWICEDWQEALVSIAGHEVQHLRMYRLRHRGAQRGNETETEWASYRCWKDWREERGT